jgi:hypothetical protein
MELSKPKVLIFDIETAPILGYVWSIWEQNVGLNQINKDWHVISWAAKWLGTPASAIFYQDQRSAKRIDDDRKLLQGIWQLLDEADVVITQNGKAFDQKKLFARFALQGFKPPSSFKHIDTKILAKKHFAFTSNRLEYLTDKLCTKYKKLKSKKFPGFDLWRECLAGNQEAWAELKRYNIHDVLSLEELYTKLAPWDTTNPLGQFQDIPACSCGSKKFQKRGYHVTVTGKFQRYQCSSCGAWTRDRENLLTPEVRKKRRVGVPS